MRSTLSLLLLLTALPLAAQRVETADGRCEAGRAVASLGFDRVHCALCTTRADGRPQFGVEPTILQPRRGARGNADLRDGDVLVAIADVPVTTPAAVDSILALRPGDSTTLRVRRDGRRHDVRIRVGTRCTADTREALPFALLGGIHASGLRAGARSRSGTGGFGLAFWCVGECAERTVDGGRRWTFTEPPRVAGIEPESPASRAGLRTGDVIVEVDGYATTSRAGADRFLGLSAGTAARLLIERAGRRIELVVPRE